VSVSSDGLYPPAEQAWLASRLGNARYEILESAHGHDGFLIETAAAGALIAGFRKRDVGARPARVSATRR
jgi:homoserine O-acetyltransferase